VLAHRNFSDPAVRQNTYHPHGRVGSLNFAKGTYLRGRPQTLQDHASQDGYALQRVRYPIGLSVHHLYADARLLHPGDLGERASYTEFRFDSC
jgi:hypothetical protein